LKLAGQDLRLQPYRVRHSELCRLLEECQGEDTLALAEMHSLDSWRQLSEQAERSSDRPLGGALLIRQGLDGEGQTAAEWYSIEPELHKARLVLRHVTLGQRGSAGDIVELSLGAILGAGLITVCKVPASLPSSDVRDLSVVVKGSTIERIGPVRVLQPEQVFEVSFRGVKASSRHKSGLALIDPVLLSWCRGVPADTAVKLSHLQGLQDNP
jgi:DNA ligase-1